MAKPEDVARALLDVAQKQAKSEARYATGIKPGFDPATGIAWTEDGRARYRTSAALPFLFQYRTSGFGVSDTDELRIDASTLIEDEQGLVTTGATTWQFAPAVAGWYAPTIHFQWFPSGGDIATGDWYRIQWYRNNTTVAEIFRWDAPCTWPASTITTEFVRPVLFFDVGDQVNFRLENQTGRDLIFSDGFISMEKIGNAPA